VVLIGSPGCARTVLKQVGHGKKSDFWQKSDFSLIAPAPSRRKTGPVPTV
jgi:hypothetical protein